MLRTKNLTLQKFLLPIHKGASSVNSSEFVVVTLEVGQMIDNTMAVVLKRGVSFTGLQYHSRFLAYNIDYEKKTFFRSIRVDRWHHRPLLRHKRALCDRVHILDGRHHSREEEMNLKNNHLNCALLVLFFFGNPELLNTHVHQSNS